MIDGVSIVRNANPTGLVVLPSTKTIRENTCNDVLLTRDWWERKKVFLCDTGGYDFSDAKKRFGAVADSMRTTGTVTDYRDTIKSSSGDWSESLGALSQTAADPVSDCELACKTRKAKVDSQANLLGTSSQYQADTQSYDIIYRTCDNNGLCPAESGEEIIKNCQCLNEFNEAASMMQMLRLGGQDAICTTGEEKALK
jgi:hypothetical protein